MRLTMTDEFTKEGSAIDFGAIRPPRVIEVLSRLVSEFGASTALRKDNELFLDRRTVDRHCVDGVNKPWQNALTESLNGSSTRNASISNDPPVPTRTFPSRNDSSFAISPLSNQTRRPSCNGPGANVSDASPPRPVA